MDDLLVNSPKIIIITETWLTAMKNKTTADIKEYGFNLYHKIRKHREKEIGGGVGTLVKADIKCTQVPSKSYHSFECSVTKVPLLKNKYMLIIVVYRLQFVPMGEFFDEFTDMLDAFTIMYEDFVIAGDINIHLETNETSSTRFNNLLEVYNLKQHVDGPTHIKGHTIDIVISPNKPLYITDVSIRQIEPHHHFLIDFVINVSALSTATKVITFRDKKNVDSLKLKEELKEKLENRSKPTTLADHVDEYNEIVSNIWDKHAPIRQKRIRVVASAPWFDSEYKNLRKKRRKAEKKYRRSKSQNDKQLYIQLKKQTLEVARSKKRSYISDRLKDGSSKSLHSVVNTLMDNKSERVLPNADSDEHLAEKFLQFFSEKIKKIRAKFDEVPQDTISRQSPKQLSHLRLTTAEELSSIIKSHGIKCSPLDPLPADILTTNLDVLLPVWVQIVNLSLVTGNMATLKNPVLSPLIKELSSLIDTENLKNYRPISNLLFISKLIERVVDIRLQEHLETNKLNMNQQYGYKKGHSTELLLLKVVNNLLESADKNIPSVVLLLDLSAAFDTVDQTKLLDILLHEIGITDSALCWFESFLLERTQKVKIGDSFSQEQGLLYGVPQGSVLGPRLFNIYIRSLYSYIADTKFNIEGFADDHQLVKQFVVTMQPIALGHNIRNCLAKISDWMSKYFLCLNEDKTKIMVIAPPAVKKKLIIQGVILNNSCIRFVDTAKNLGIFIDSLLSFEKQVSNTVKSCNSTVRELWRIKSYLSEKQLHQLVSCRIFSQLDYCNVVYYGIPYAQQQKLQRIQNSAARLVCKTKMSSTESLDSVIADFHWLKVEFRIIFKILLIVHNCIYNKAPEPIAALVTRSESSRTIRLLETEYRSSYGARAFSHVGPKLWNLLPPTFVNKQKLTISKKA